MFFSAFLTKIKSFFFIFLKLKAWLHQTSKRISRIQILTLLPLSSRFYLNSLFICKTYHLKMLIFKFVGIWGFRRSESFLLGLHGTNRKERIICIGSWIILIRSWCVRLWQELHHHLKCLSLMWDSLLGSVLQSVSQYFCVFLSFRIQCSFLLYSCCLRRHYRRRFSYDIKLQIDCLKSLQQ